MLSGLIRPLTEAAISKVVFCPSINVKDDTNGLPSLATNSGIESGVLEINMSLETPVEKLSVPSLDAPIAVKLNED